MNQAQARAAIDGLTRQGAIPRLLFLNSAREYPALPNNLKYRTAFNEYYQIRRRPREFYDVMFSLLKDMVSGQLPLNLKLLLLEMHRATNARHLSICSKILVTATDNAVVYDKKVAAYFRVATGEPAEADWLKDAISRYSAIRQEIGAIVATPNWAAICVLFDKAFPEARQLPGMRKADLIVGAHVALGKRRN